MALLPNHSIARMVLKLYFAEIWTVFPGAEAVEGGNLVVLLASLVMVSDVAVPVCGVNVKVV